MQADGKNTKATTPATTPDATIGVVEQKLWAILGLKMAVDRLRELGYEVVASSQENGAAAIVVQFGLSVNLDSGTVNGKDIVASLDVLRTQRKEKT